MKNKKVAVIGSKGMLGKALMKSVIDAGGYAFGLARSGGDYDVDVLDLVAMEGALSAITPDVVINCVALVNLSQCESDPSLAYAVNSRPSAFLSNYCLLKGIKYVYISTDHYYSGGGRLLNSELSQVNLCNEYALTKYIGESLSLVNDSALVVRTNIVGYRGDLNRPTFFEWLLKALEDEEKITAFDDFFTSSIDVESFSRALLELITKEARGVINLASGQASSKAEFITRTAEIFGFSMENVVIASTTTSDKIVRNINLGLCVEKAEMVLDRPLPDLDQTIMSLKKAKQ